ncbi:hypothetical protein MB02_13655 [Croceicoccus estronivorus]|uniref:hypothetical protein n=1 Tax=Croceicoccus estronivorus TaxID=1172626 RepID=UPI000831093E|nr:hypothetical protein [Croceicoccus estronivorus]OCC23194.1 hypothetical protein MB02_13655 [Croceicoccus estronivorus]
MMEAGVSQFDDQMVESMLSDELTRGDATIVSAGSILRHLLENADHTMFSDEIVARVRGMVSDLARQLLVMQAEVAGADDPHAFTQEQHSALTEVLISNAALLGHVHGLALEFQITEQLHAREAIDGVLSPLLQALIESDDSATATAAMSLLASQARFCQQQRRMELPLGELPGELFHTVILSLRDNVLDDREAAAKAEEKLRAEFDESHSRLGLLARLVVAMGGGTLAALSVAHAGVALFLTALAFATGQDRLRIVLASNERQVARFAVLLCAAGLKPREVEAEFAHFHPDIGLPAAILHLGDRATAILAASTAELAG